MLKELDYPTYTVKKLQLEIFGVAQGSAAHLKLELNGNLFNFNASFVNSQFFFTL